MVVPITGVTNKSAWWQEEKSCIGPPWDLQRGLAERKIAPAWREFSVGMQVVVAVQRVYGEIKKKSY